MKCDRPTLFTVADDNELREIDTSVGGITTESEVSFRTSGDFRGFVTMAIVVSAIVCLPSTYLYYSAPFVGVAMFGLDTKIIGRFLASLIAVVTLSLTAMAIDSMRGMQSNVPGVLVGCITYAPWLMAFSVLPRTRCAAPDSQWFRVTRLVACFVILQSVVGYFEFAITRDGDMVCGTFGLVNVLEGKKTISQVLFTFTLICCLLFLGCYREGPLSRVAIVLGAATVALAQSGHQSILLLICIPTVLVISYRKVGATIKGCLFAAAAASLLYYCNPNTAEVAQMWWSKVVVSENSVKRHVASTAIATLSDPKNFVIGTGMGQFSSRAALITSGEYLTVPIPAVLQGRATYFQEGVEPEMLTYRRIGEGSAISKPFFSGVSIPVEFGIPAAVSLIAILVVLMWRNSRRALCGGEAGRLAVASNIGLLLFGLCCGIENYAEMVQAVTIPLLLLLLSGMRMRHLESELESAGDVA